MLAKITGDQEEAGAGKRVRGNPGKKKKTGTRGGETARSPWLMGGQQTSQRDVGVNNHQGVITRGCQKGKWGPAKEGTHQKRENKNVGR